jgi:hypothetical protein
VCAWPARLRSGGEEGRSLREVLFSECGQVLAGRGGRSCRGGEDGGAEYLRERVGPRGKDWVERGEEDGERLARLGDDAPVGGGGGEDVGGERGGGGEGRERGRLYARV